MYNKVILVGNLTHDIELRYSQGGMGIAKTALATTRKFTANGEKKEDVCFVDITFFGRSAEIANQYLRKGSKILIEGRLNFEQWSDQDGQKRSKHSVTPKQATNATSCISKSTRPVYGCTWKHITTAVSTKIEV
jgi:single-strand DNA-binding protein